MRSTVTTIIFMTILAMTLLVSYKSVMAKTDNSREVPFTQDDRDRIIRLEEGQKSLQQQISDLRNLVYVVLGGIIGLLAGMVGMVGFVIWDRRTAVAPVARKSKELEEREELIEKALKEYAKVEPRLAEILKSLRLM
jgi:hypothetical protein